MRAPEKTNCLFFVDSGVLTTGDETVDEAVDYYAFVGGILGPVCDFTRLATYA